MEIHRLKSIYSDIKFADGFVKSTDDDGNSFITITSGGLKAEGMGVSAYYATQELAEDAFDRQFADYAKGCKRVNVRALPETKRISVIIPSAWEPSGDIELQSMSLYYTRGRFTFIK